MVADFDSRLDEVWDDPDGVLRELREREPVHWSEPEQAWIITRRADAVEILRRSDVFTTDLRVASGSAGETVRATAERSPLPFGSLLTSSEGQRHQRLRRTAAASFSPEATAALRSAIRQVVASTLSKRSGASLDVVGEFARPLANGVTLHVLGLNASTVSAFARDTQTLIRGAAFAVGPQPSEPEISAAQSRLRSMLAPDSRIDLRPGSLLSRLFEARRLGRVDDDELFGLAVFIATVGQAPLSFAVASAVLALLRNEREFERARSDRRVRANLLDETLRLASPVRVLRRVALRETLIGGQRIQAGQIAQIVVPAVNRDPEAFSDPNRFDLERDASGHLAFGWGRHRCLGAELSQVVAQEAFDGLFEHFPAMVAGDRLEIISGETTGPALLEIRNASGESTPEPTRNIALDSMPIVGRNHACPCGSGKKYKRCHGHSSHGLRAAAAGPTSNNP